MRINSYNRLTLANGESKLIKADKGEGWGSPCLKPKAFNVFVRHTAP